MKMRKLLAAVSALAMTLALTTTALAEDQSVNASGQINMTIGSRLEVPTIAVTIAQATDMIVNPYQLKVDINGTDVTSSLITTPALITNSSTIGVKITATPSVTVSDGVTVASDEWDDASAPTAKTIFMKLKMAKGSTNNAADIAWAGVASNQSTVIQKTGSLPVELTLDAAANASTPAYGGYKIDGKSGGEGWTAENISVNIVFDIKAVLGSGSAS